MKCPPSFDTRPLEIPRWKSLTVPPSTWKLNQDSDLLKVTQCSALKSFMVQSPEGLSVNPCLDQRLKYLSFHGL